ncbi:hypothetical protein [Roseivirga sp. E12]|uniref:hypothetical protein n=1 Tax=Roseivirga sp. E12 TaxID=2819237 RepID=UPI001ABCBE4C|nr:hypothetical protein [Roseivirga sp. E12]MBO3698201.1 hypothetical protein [Roseivirga sp. E12]
MSKESTFFERLLSYSQSKGVKNVSALSEALGYDKPEKLYRLKRDPSARPSFDVLAGITKLFEDLNLRWLITGDGERELVESSQALPNMVEEPQSIYVTKSQAQRKLLKEKERLIKQQQETISALQEAYGLLKHRLEEGKK